jgi:hypothetical protein
LRFDFARRSVTEMDMIAITPMPPTISAIDEIDEREKRRAADLVPTGTAWLPC